MSEHQQNRLPRITILTPCLNAERYIAEALESVRTQYYPDIEHIILDAGSNDGTLARLAGFPGLRVISEADNGSHDAMNKGVGLASGDIIGFLNADDFYAAGLLSEVAEVFAKDPHLDVATVGTVVFEDTSNGERQVLVARNHRVDSGFWLAELAFGAPGFNGRFFRRRVFDQIGAFDLAYDFSADRHFLIRIALSGAKTVTLPRFGYFFRSHPRSRTLDATRRNSVAFAREHIPQAAYFARTAHTTGQRSLFMAWRAFEGTKLAYFGLKAHTPAAAARATLSLTRDDPLWPARLPLAFASRRAVRSAEAESTRTFIKTVPKWP